MLEFNPFFRKRPEEYLSLKLFDPWVAKYPELLVPPTSQIRLDVDQKNVYNYKDSKFKTLKMPELKAILL